MAPPDHLLTGARNWSSNLRESFYYKNTETMLGGENIKKFITKYLQSDMEFMKQKQDDIEKNEKDSWQLKIS